jgi:2-methylcitrate dehydratase
MATQAAAATVANRTVSTAQGQLLEVHDTDHILERLADFAAAVNYDTLPAATIKAAKERIVDSVGCAIGAQGCETAEIGKRVATLATSPRLAGRVLGSDEIYDGQSAAFINSCLIRDLDFSDTYPGGHPSDALGGLIAVAPALSVTGRELIEAMVIAYEIFIRFQDAGQISVKGWDNGFHISIGTAAGIAKMMGCNREQIKHAIALTACANMPMRASRAGQLSHWKGASTAYHIRNAVFGAQIAAEGMTGPESPFTGRDALEQLVTGKLDLPLFGTEGGEWVTRRTKIKYWPVAYQLQALVWCGIALREKLNGKAPTDIQVLTFHFSWRESGSEPAKWDPQTRETADHSAPYILAWVLRHGSIDHRAFMPESYLDPTIRPLMNMIKVSPDEEITRQYPKMFRMRMMAHDEDGNRHEVEVINALGHHDNPMNKQQFDEKFCRLTAAALTPDRQVAALEAWWNIDQMEVARAMDAVSTRQ